MSEPTTRSTFLGDFTPGQTRAILLGVGLFLGVASVMSYFEMMLKVTVDGFPVVIYAWGLGIPILFGLLMLLSSGLRAFVLKFDLRVLFLFNGVRWAAFAQAALAANKCVPPVFGWAGGLGDMTSAAILSISALWSLFSGSTRMPRGLARFALIFGTTDLVVSTAWATALSTPGRFYDPLSVGLLTFPYDLIYTAFIPLLFCVLISAIYIWFAGDGRYLTE